MSLRSQKLAARCLMWVFAVAGGTLMASATSAQISFDPASGEPIEEPLAYDFGVGARAMGMGGAHAAVVEDASAILYNPAGLAMIRRIELSAAFSHQHDELDVDYRGSLLESPLSSTKLHQIALAYPIPTYRGSFVLGFAYHRTVSLDRDYFRSGLDPGGGLETESFTERGGLRTYSIAAAFDASPDISVGGTLSLLGGSSDQDYYIENSRDVDCNYSYASDSDIDGVTGSLGLLYKFEPMGRFGLSVDFPRRMDLNGTFEDPDAIYRFKDRIILPFALTGGIAFTPQNFVFAVDLKFTDWSQIDYNGPIRAFDEVGRRIYVYESTTQVRAGVEALLPGMPVRLRAGYLRDPIPYKLLFTDCEYYMGEMDEVRDYFTFGGGIILENSLSLDVAFMTGGYQRSAQGTIEDLNQNRVFVSAAYRY